MPHYIKIKKLKKKLISLHVACRSSPQIVINTPAPSSLCISWFLLRGEYCERGKECIQKITIFDHSLMNNFSPYVFSLQRFFPPLVIHHHWTFPNAPLPPTSACLPICSDGSCFLFPFCNCITLCQTSFLDIVKDLNGKSCYMCGFQKFNCISIWHDKRNSILITNFDMQLLKGMCEYSNWEAGWEKCGARTRRSGGYKLISNK